MASTLRSVVSGPSPEQYILDYDLSCQLICCHLASARMFPSELSTGQDQVPSRFALGTTDIVTLTQNNAIPISNLLSPSLKIPFRTRIAADTSFLGPNYSARDVCLLDDLPGQCCTDPLWNATPAPSVKRRAREIANTRSARSFDARHDICIFSSGSQCMHFAAAS